MTAYHVTLPSVLATLETMSKGGSDGISGKHPFLGHVRDRNAETQDYDWGTVHLTYAKEDRAPENLPVADRRRSRVGDFELVFGKATDADLGLGRALPVVEDESRPSDAQADMIESASDLDETHVDDLVEKRERANADRRKYKDRIETLRRLGKEDGYDLNRESGQDFWNFVDSIPLIRKGELCLIDNGNLRAVWKDEQGAHIGLQFQGNGRIQYVIFSRKPSTGDVWRGCGRCDFEVAKHLIQTFALWQLISW